MKNALNKEQEEKLVNEFLELLKSINSSSSFKQIQFITVKLPKFLNSIYEMGYCIGETEGDKKGKLIEIKRLTDNN